MKLPAILVVLLGTAALGYYLPAVLLDWAVRKRQSAILRPFPDALDLLVCCVEAGLGLDAAFRRVAEEMEPAAPELSSGSSQVNHEIAAGVPRADALKRLDTRTGLNEMGSLVSVLVQADRFGTSIAKALQIIAELVRKKRMLAAEEQASRISPKLTVVMILFILPTLMVVLVGPAIINIGRNLWPTLQGVRCEGTLDRTVHGRMCGTTHQSRRGSHTDWATKSGRVEAKIELAEALVLNGTPEAALQMISQMVEAGVSHPDLFVLKAEP